MCFPARTQQHSPKGESSDYGWAPTERIPPVTKIRSKGEKCKLGKGAVDLQPVEFIHLRDNYRYGRGDKNRKLLMLDWDSRARSRPEGEAQWASLGQ